MDIIENQHFVPQFYLNSWRDNGELWVFDKNTFKVRKRGPRTVACGSHFYDTPATLNQNEPDLFQMPERVFGDIENYLAPIFAQARIKASLLAGAIHIPFANEFLTENDLLDLCDFTALQMLRVEILREQFQENYAKLAPKYALPVVASNNWIKAFQIDFAASRTSVIGELLTQKTIVFGINKTGIPLVTSDNPVNMLGIVVDPNVAWDGLLSPGIEIVYPLSPVLTISFYDPKFHTNMRQYNRRWRLLTPHNVITYNHHQVLQSNRQIFSVKKSFEFCQTAIIDQAVWNRNRLRFKYAG